MLKSALVWTNPKGRELIRLNEGGDEATIIPMTCNEADRVQFAAKGLAECGPLPVAVCRR